VPVAQEVETAVTAGAATATAEAATATAEAATATAGAATGAAKSSGRILVLSGRSRAAQSLSSAAPALCRPQKAGTGFASPVAGLNAGVSKSGELESQSPEETRARAIESRACFDNETSRERVTLGLQPTN
jgi:hypothetical protein